MTMNADGTDVDIVVDNVAFDKNLFVDGKDYELSLLDLWAMSHTTVNRHPVPGILKEENPLTCEFSYKVLRDRRKFLCYQLVCYQRGQVTSAVVRCL